MPRLFFVALVAAISLAKPSLAQDKSLPAVKPILEEAVIEVRKNRQEFDRNNETPLAEARRDLQELVSKLVNDDKRGDAQAVLKQIETLQPDVLRIASGGERPALKPPVKTILEKAVREVRKNQEAFDKANHKPLGSARDALETLAKQQNTEGKTKEAIATLQQIETLERDVLKMANAPLPQQGGPVVPAAPIPKPAGDIVWNGHRYAFFGESTGWLSAKKKCEQLGGYLVIFDSKDEATSICQHFKDKESAWVGVTNSTPDGKWRTVRDDLAAYLPWGHREPHPNGSEHEVSCDLDDGEFHDTNDRKFAFICEWDTPAPVADGGGARPPKPLLNRMAGKWVGEGPGPSPLTIQPDGKVQKSDGNHGLLVLVSPDVAEMTWRGGTKYQLRIVNDSTIAVTIFDQKGNPTGGRNWQRLK